MERNKEFSVLICDDSEAERRRFYERQFENFDIYGVVRRDGEFVEVDPMDSVEKLHRTLMELRARGELPDIVLLDLFYKRPLPDVDARERAFVSDLLRLKKEFEQLRVQVNEYLIPSGVDLLRRIRVIDGISSEELPICVYTDKNFNFLLSKEFNTIYEFAPSSMSKDRDFDEPNSMIPASTEYFRILKVIQQNKGAGGISGSNPNVFISHGRSKDWMEVQAFVERELDVRTIELAQEVAAGRTVIDKLHQASLQCDYAIVVMTGDDCDASGVARVRENVMHEIGFFQGRLGLDRVCLLHEEGTSIPSNLGGLVYLAYGKGNVRAAFADLMNELGARVQHG